jgi:uncharacterized membrane protein YfcA
MDFPISGAHLNPILLAAVGFVVGVFGGFFGVGGSFLAGPALFLMGLPFNFVVGTDLAHIVGKSLVAAREHVVRGNVAIKLAAVLAVGTVIGSEVGAQAVEYLEKIGLVNQVVGVTFIGVLVLISAFMAWESWNTMKRRSDEELKSAPGSSAVSADVRRRSAPPMVRNLHDKVQSFKLPPMISLPRSDIESISLWIVVAVGLLAGFMAGFIGGGAGFLRMPLLVYVIGVPTKIAVGTDLVEVAVSAGYGTLSHALKGNVDIMIALVMHTGAAIGAQIGVRLTDYFAGPKIRLAFSPLPLVGAALIIWKLLSGIEPT